MGRTMHYCQHCETQLFDDMPCFICEDQPTPQQLASLAEKQGFALVPLERTPKEALGFFKKVDGMLFKEWGPRPMELNEESASRALKVMIEVGRVDPQNPD